MAVMITATGERSTRRARRRRVGTGRRVQASYGDGEAEAEAVETTLADRALAGANAPADAELAAVAPAEALPVGAWPVGAWPGPAPVVRKMGVSGGASAPAAGSVSVTVPGSPGPASDRMADTV